MKPGRIPCVVPFCRCTAAETNHPGCDEIICAKHWRAVPRALKARKRAAERLADRAESDCDRFLAKTGVMTTRLQGRYRAAWKAARKIWRRCKSNAVEAAGGIG